MNVNLKKRQQNEDKKYKEKLMFLFFLAAAEACRNNKISLKRTQNILKDMNDIFIENCKFLTSNICTQRNKFGLNEKSYDYEYNQAKLKAKAEELGVYYDSKLFEE